MKYLGFPRRGSWSRAVLLNVVWCSIAVAGQMVLSSSTSSASNLNFGSVQVGSSSTISTAVSNPGRSNLTITRTTVSGKAFRYSGPNLPVIVGSGLTADLVPSLFPTADGAIVGQWLKRDGLWWNPVDPRRVEQLMKAVAKFRDGP